jgi:peptide deformylase
MEVLKIGDPRLREKAQDVTMFDGDLAATTKQMLKILLEIKGVGLAGPQVGIPERFFVVLIDKDTPLVFANPVILETSPQEVVCQEGCLSIPGVWAELTRPEWIVVQARNARGRLFNTRADGMLARVIQHENDHLDGKLFVDHLSAQKRARVLEKYEHRLKRKAGKEVKEGDKE